MAVAPSGMNWVVKLEAITVMIDLIEYPLPPIEQILGILVGLSQEPALLSNAG